jgi:hypothetical protein
MTNISRRVPNILQPKLRNCGRIRGLEMISIFIIGNLSRKTSANYWKLVEELKKSCLSFLLT